MRYQSTQSSNEMFSFREALEKNLPGDGGLFVPNSFPVLSMEQFLKLQNYSEFSVEILKYFLDLPIRDLRNYCESAFNFPTPVTELDSEVFYLELFHGPTAAFKDYGARFLAQTLTGETGTIVVATSGDTGGAVASAFWKMSGYKVIILFPNGRISKRQELQLTNWGENISSFAVNGSFDDCQRMVKSAMALKNLNLKSANSISIGRILPQMVYYAYSSLIAFKKNKKVSQYFIPTGNAGNACAALWAKQLGFPIGKINLVCNANATIKNYFETGIYKSVPSVSTLANAMDVGHPSNFERILSVCRNDWNRVRKEMAVFSVADTEIKKTISAIPFGQIICPHTATAFFAYLNSTKTKDINSILVGTAHPAKFETIVEPLVNSQIAIPHELQKTLMRPSQFKVISNSDSEFLDIIKNDFQ